MKEATRFWSENLTWVLKALVCVLNSAADLAIPHEQEPLKPVYNFF